MLLLTCRENATHVVLTISPTTHQERLVIDAVGNHVSHHVFMYSHLWIACGRCMCPRTHAPSTCYPYIAIHEIMMGYIVANGINPMLGAGGWRTACWRNRELVSAQSGQHVPNMSATICWKSAMICVFFMVLWSISLKTCDKQSINATKQRLPMATNKKCFFLQIL